MKTWKANIVPFFCWVFGGSANITWGLDEALLSEILVDCGIFLSDSFCCGFVVYISDEWHSPVFLWNLLLRLTAIMILIK